ncbi:MAG TPA: 50S ribosomal protein L10 [Actinomycetota bacterium]|jgi:large subunit ribosomal protein L10|nr:50S ribosomal protein L10 [Actinomycetota bacterium]
MPKPQKVAAVKELREKLESSDAALLAEFTGLKVGEMMQVRRSLAENGTEFGVVKNTLGRIAATEANMADLIPLLRGSTAIAFVNGDAVLAAKSLDDVAKKYPALVVKGGILGGKVLDAQQAKALASVESREVLLSKLAGLLNSPIQKMASLLYAPLGSLGNALYALQQQRGVAAANETEAPAPADAEAPAPAAAPEAPAPTEDAPAAPEAAAATENTPTEDSSGAAETQA